MEHLGQEVLKLLTDWQPSKHNSIILEEKSRRLIKRFMVLKWDVSNVKDPTTPKTVHSKRKVKPLKKIVILNLVHPSNKEGNIEQQLWDSTKGIMQILRQISKVLQERGFGSLPSSTKTNSRDHVKSISTTVEANMTPICRIGSSQYARSYRLQFLEAYLYGASHINDSVPQKEKDPGSFTLPCYINNVCFENTLASLGELVHTKLTVELADRTVKHPKGIAENVLVGIGKFIFPVDFIILDMPEDVKVPLILGKPFLSTAHAKIDVFKRKITLRVREEKIIFKSVKPASSLIKRVYMLSLRERMELDMEARLMGETLMLNRSLDPLYGDYIELNDLNVPLELRRDQVDDLMATVEEGEVVDKHMIKEVKTWNNNEIVSKNFGYPSDYNQDEKICIDCAYNLKYGYCKNHKKTVKTGQTRTQERKSTQRAGRKLSKVKSSQLKSTFGQLKSNHKKTKLQIFPNQSLII
ncbi:retrovirus-related pol polyprotein from transposon TNT 1-94 [Tanacetum coccineum]